MKYIVTKSRVVYVFPDDMSHGLVKRGNIKSAGYVRPRGNGIQLYGKSKSLKVKSDKNDTKLVLKKLHSLSINYIV